MSHVAMTELESDLKKTEEVLESRLAAIQTGRAQPNLIEAVKVEHYGTEMQLNQMGVISAPEARLLTVQVWDISAVQAVEKALRTSSLGLNPQVDGQLIRIPLPPLTEERRAELTKNVGEVAEEVRVTIRNHRQKAIKMIKESEESKELSEDESRRLQDEVQKKVDAANDTVAARQKAKAAELMQT